MPLLPSNPNTIAPSVMDAADRLTYLRRIDTYERKTTLERELEKLKLEQQINTEIKND